MEIGYLVTILYQKIDYEVAAKSLLNAVKWLGETRDGAMYHVFWDALNSK